MENSAWRLEEKKSTDVKNRKDYDYHSQFNNFIFRIRKIRKENMKTFPYYTTATFLSVAANTAAAPGDEDKKMRVLSSKRSGSFYGPSGSSPTVGSFAGPSLSSPTLGSFASGSKSSSGSGSYSSSKSSSRRVLTSAAH